MNAANPPPGFPDPLAPPVPLNVALAPPHTYAEYYAREAAVQPADTLAPYMAQFQADAPYGPPTFTGPCHRQCHHPLGIPGNLYH